ncbi:MAG: hypothetical protein D4R88_10160 [Methanosarcinales archaeon]|nr:MAG: hypothetical protein D4R88_10160 [Methanosarcinales archaeon]
MSFPGTTASFLANVTLMVQIAAFIILIFGVLHAKKKDFLKHFKTADIAVVFGILAFLWMSYRFVINFRAIILNITSQDSLLLIVHVVAGILGLSGGIAFVLNKFIKKTLISMRMVFLAWTIALLLGIVLYAIYYVS